MQAHRARGVPRSAASPGSMGRPVSAVGGLLPFTGRPRLHTSMGTRQSTVRPIRALSLVLLKLKDVNAALATPLT
jgi:hypothetical protein